MIKSPCIKVCRMDHKNKFCKGCGRTINQIVNWQFYTDKDKKIIIINIKEKLKILNA